MKIIISPDESVQIEYNQEIKQPKTFSLATNSPFKGEITMETSKYTNFPVWIQMSDILEKDEDPEDLNVVGLYLSIEDAKKIRNYLNHSITYLEKLERDGKR